MARREDFWNLKPGERGYIRIPVTVDLGGHELFLPVHVVRGHRPGPTVTLLSCLNGNQWPPIDILRRVLERVNPHELSGNLLAVTVANPLALTLNRRNTPDDSESPDLNDAFGGPWNWPSHQLARTLSKEVFARSSYLLDFHSLCWVAYGVVVFATGFSDPATDQRNRELAQAFGYPMIYEVPHSPRNACGHAGRMGIPAITVEIGGAGFAANLEDAWLEENVSGILNVLRAYHLLPGTPKVPDRYCYWSKRWRVEPTKGGYLQSLVPPERLLGEVAPGELLGIIRSPLSMEVIEELRSPGKGLLYCVARSYVVRPGEWAFGIADLESVRMARPGHGNS